MQLPVGTFPALITLWNGPRQLNYEKFIGVIGLNAGAMLQVMNAMLLEQLFHCIFNANVCILQMSLHAVRLTYA